MSETPEEDTATRDSGRQGIGGDDERESREHMARTGEPERDEQGNQDGAS